METRQQTEDLKRQDGDAKQYGSNMGQQAGDTRHPQRYCRKCLLKDMPEAVYFENLYHYIRQLDADLKVEDEVYQQRLGKCRQCDHLLNGMCRICGCYVELRAVMKIKSCPDVTPRW